MEINILLNGYATDEVIAKTDTDITHVEQQPRINMTRVYV